MKDGRKGKSCLHPTAASRRNPCTEIGNGDWHLFANRQFQNLKMRDDFSVSLLSVTILACRPRVQQSFEFSVVLVAFNFLEILRRVKDPRHEQRNISDMP
jgi:hypothetical protein